MPISDCRSPTTMLTDPILITILITIAVEDKKGKYSLSHRHIFKNRLSIIKASSSSKSRTL